MYRYLEIKDRSCREFTYCAYICVKAILIIFPNAIQSHCSIVGCASNQTGIKRYVSMVLLIFKDKYFYYLMFNF